MTRTNKESLQRNCFIVAPLGAELGQLKSAFGRRSVELMGIDRSKYGGQSLARIRNLMKKADFVCVVLPDSLSANLMLEAGIAGGLGKPILIIAGESSNIQFDLDSMSVVPIRSLDSDALEWHLDAFLATLPQHKRSKLTSSSPSKPQNPNSSNWARQRLKAFTSGVWKTGPEAQMKFEEFIAELFRRTGYTVTESPLENYGVDMAIWSSKVKKSLGSPLLVQAKHGAISLPETRQVSQRLSELIQNGRGSAALFVTPRGTAFEAPLFDGTTILPLAADQLIKFLENGTFLPLVTSLRNDRLSWKL